MAADTLPKFFPHADHRRRLHRSGQGAGRRRRRRRLQAIATARRLGAVVEAYDTRPVVKEQVESLGAKFVDIPVDTSDAQTAGGYAKEVSAETCASSRRSSPTTPPGPTSSSPPRRSLAARRPA